MYLASHIGRWSTTTIGRFYGGRDHSTVVHAIQRVERLRVADLEMEALLSEFERSLAGTKEQGTSGTVPIPIGSNRVPLRAYQRFEPGTRDALVNGTAPEEW
jgi:DnaA-like protein